MFCSSLRAIECRLNSGAQTECHFKVLTKTPCSAKTPHLFLKARFSKVLWECARMARLWLMCMSVWVLHVAGVVGRWQGQMFFTLFSLWNGAQSTDSCVSVTVYVPAEGMLRMRTALATGHWHNPKSISAWIDPGASRSLTAALLQESPGMAPGQPQGYLTTVTGKGSHVHIDLMLCAPVIPFQDRKSTRLNSSHSVDIRMPPSAWK